MTIIIGLGNPGKKFENTRHNVGFMAIDKFAKENNFSDFELQKKFDAMVSEKENILLVKPETFMNESGVSAKKILSKKNIDDIILIHDDIDLPIGKIKIVKERGSAGHKGVESVIKAIGNKGLIRIRIGIGGLKNTEAMKVVLKNFSEKDEKEKNKSIKNTVKALQSFIENGLEKTMNEFNK
jgi:PTH1 family peptidyl-tRNA hydrolase